MPANANDIRTFAQARERLEAIVGQVKGNDTPLEKSLDLYEEAIRVGNRCSDLIDNVDFTAEEVAVLRSGEVPDVDDVVEAADGGSVGGIDLETRV
jgi:exodeoxyribonuclease VII small subunit